MTRLQHTRLMMDLGYALGCGKIPDRHIEAGINRVLDTDAARDRLMADIQSASTAFDTTEAYQREMDEQVPEQDRFDGRDHNDQEQWR